MPPPLPPQLRALSRHFSSTPYCLKAHARPAASVRNKAKQPWNLGNKPQDTSSEPGISIPTEILMSAHKSKSLPFGPAVATLLIRSYMPMLKMVPNEEAGRALCAAHKITPHDLTLLALVLLKSTSSTSSPQQPVLARHLLATCSALSDPTATIQLHKLLVKAPKNTFTVMELQQVVRRLAKIASEAGHPGALFRMGEVLEEQGKDAKAEECYRRAGVKGVGEAWVRLGRLQMKAGRSKEAEASFEKGRELDNPHAYYYLAIQSPTSPTHKTYLLKAAASGIIEAAHNLGVYYQSTSPNPTLAQEWYTIAATEGFAPSQVNLAVMLKSAGKLLTACEWLAKAQREPGEVGLDAGRLRKEMESEMEGKGAF